MKYLKLILLSFILFSIQTTLNSQIGIFKKKYKKKPSVNLRSNHTIHFGIATGFSLHYNTPVRTRGVPVGSLYDSIEQKANNSLQFNLAWNAKVFPRHDFFFGLGISQNRFSEKGIFNRPTGMINTPFLRVPYSVNVSYKYYNFSFGHRYIFYKKMNHSAFVENQIIHDWHQKSDKYNSSDFYKRSGFSYKINIGLETVHTTKFKILFSLYFKTAFVKYNQWKYNKDFYPYSYGIQGEFAFAFKNRKKNT